MGAFQDFIRRLIPGYMAGRYASTFGEAIGLVLDELAARTYQGMRESIPYAGDAVDAYGVALECSLAMLLWHAKDHGVRLYESESPTGRRIGRRVRVARWHDLHRQRGTPQGALFNVQPFFLGTAYDLPWIRVVQQSGNAARSYPATWGTVDPTQVYSRHVETPGNFDYDGQHGLFARWWAIMYLPAGYGAPWAWDDGTLWDGGAVWDGVSAVALGDFIEALREGGETPGNKLAGVFVTFLSPTSDIGGGAHPFDPASAAQTFGDGSTSLPTGNWSDPAGRPLWAQLVYDNPG